MKFCSQWNCQSPKPLGSRVVHKWFMHCNTQDFWASNFFWVQLVVNRRQNAHNSVSTRVFGVCWLPLLQIVSSWSLASLSNSVEFRRLWVFLAKLSFWSLAPLFIFLQFWRLWVFFIAFCPPGRWRLFLDASILTLVSFLDTNPVEIHSLPKHLGSVSTWTRSQNI